jgi:hypothetical protein
MNNKSQSSRPRRIPPNEIKSGISKLEALPTNATPPEKYPKISIGDAIGLITKRLCKLEEFALKETTADGGDTSHVLKTICDRLSELESKNKTLTDTLTALGNSPSLDNLEINTNEVDIEKLKLEVDDIKKMLLKLQERILDIITTK